MEKQQLGIGRIMKTRRCARIRHACSYRDHPIEGRTLRRDWPRIWLWHLRCPPHSILGLLLTRLVMAVLAFVAVFWFCTSVLPGDDEFSTTARSIAYDLFIVYTASRACGYFFESLGLPGLLGMIMAGMVLRNSYPNMSGKPQKYKQILKDMPYSIIAIKTGLSLDLQQMKEDGLCRITLFGITPGILEGITAGLLSWLFLDFHFWWGMTFGFTLPGISAAIIVPLLEQIRDEGYDNGIVVLVFGGIPFDCVTTFFTFALVSSFAYGDGGTVELLLKVVGILIALLCVGVVIGALLWVLPPPAKNEDEEKYKRADRNKARFVIMLLSTWAFVLCAKAYNVATIGLISAMVIAVVANQKWKSPVKEEMYALCSEIWSHVAPLIYGMLGTEIDLTILIGAEWRRRLLTTMGIIMIAMIFRCSWAFVMVAIDFKCTARSKCTRKKKDEVSDSKSTGHQSIVSSTLAHKPPKSWSLRECIFVAFAWSPKGFLQLYLGGMPLYHMKDNTQVNFPDKETYELNMETAKMIFQGSLIVLLFGASFGMLVIKFTYKFLLVKEEPVKQSNPSIIMTDKFTSTDV